MKTKGILLIAAGHVNYYRMARNLAASIKVVEPDMQIALVTADLPAIDNNEGLFDQLIPAKHVDYITLGKEEYFKLKTRMHELSPFDETLYLDVDMLWLNHRKPSDLMQLLSDIPFAVANHGSKAVAQAASYWANIEDVTRAYKLTDELWYEYSSELVWFKKKETRKYFEKVKSIFDSPKVKTMEFGGSRMADELPMMIASAVLKFYPHQSKWLPVFWHHKQPGKKNLMPYQLKEDFWAYSMGGNGHPSNVINSYNQLASYYMQKLGLPNTYKWKDKKTFLPNRKSI